MAQSGDLKFSPVLHNITPDRVVFCYRDGDTDSLQVAEYYCQQRGVPPENLIALPCKNQNFITEGEYEDSIETPLIAKLEEIGGEFTSSGQSEIYCIILGYHVPHAFFTGDIEDPYDPANSIAIASRLHRLGKTKNFKKTNHTFNRVNFKFFDANDAKELFLTAVLDGPDKATVIKLIDRSLDVDNQIFITGKIYIDPFGNKDTDSQLQYESDLLDFINFELPNLGLDFVTTVDQSPPGQDPYMEAIGQPYQDPTISELANDSFYWGWFTPEYSQSLFLNQNERRVFLYNADNDGADDIAASINPDVSNPWVTLAINVEPGYATTAGAVAPPGEDAYLQPRPFFEALHQGATVAEAFLFSSRYVDWRMVLIGDPLMVVNFPVDLPPDQDINNEELPNSEVTKRAKGSLEESIAWGVRQDRLTKDLIDKTVSSINLSEAYPLLYSLAKWHNLKNTATYHNLLSRAVDSWIIYILKTTGLTLPTWLSLRGEKTTILLNNLIKTVASSNILNNDLLLPQGEWRYDFVYTHPKQTFENINFRLQLARDSSFSKISADIMSDVSVEGWQYEAEPFVFVQLPPDGFPSNFSGRKVRFISPSENYLRRTEIFYVRWRAIDDSGDIVTDYEVDPNLFIIKT